MWKILIEAVLWLMLVNFLGNAGACAEGDEIKFGLFCLFCAFLVMLSVRLFIIKVVVG